MRFSINLRAMTALVATGSLLLAGLAAASQANAATYYGCVKKNGGVKVFTKKPKCKKGETKISWNAVGPAGKDGTKGTNGASGTSGTNGTNGTNGMNGAVGGFSARNLEGVSFTAAKEETAVTVVSRTLPAGNFIVNAKTEVLLSDNKAGGEAGVACKLVDTPTGGGAPASDTATWLTLINAPFIFVDLAQNTLPMTLAVASPAHTSTIAVVCYVTLLEAAGGIFNATANQSAITAVQTTVNG